MVLSLHMTPEKWNRENCQHYILCGLVLKPHRNCIWRKIVIFTIAPKHTDQWRDDDTRKCVSKCYNDKFQPHKHTHTDTCTHYKLPIKILKLFYSCNKRNAFCRRDTFVFDVRFKRFFFGVTRQVEMVKWISKLGKKDAEMKKKW